MAVNTSIHKVSPCHCASQLRPRALRAITSSPRWVPTWRRWIARSGAGNARPRFAVAQARIVNVQPVGADHVRCILTGPDGTGRLKAIAFRAAGTKLGAALMSARGMPLHLAGQLRLDDWQGRESAQLIIDDAAQVEA